MSATRRNLLTSMLAAGALPLAGHPAIAVSPPALAPTPACDDDAEPTRRSTAGPFYKPDVPQRRDLSGDGAGETLQLAGFVLDRQCRPLAGRIVEIWHCDGDGRYDNAGFRFRGWQRTDEAGRWWFSTIVPALYPGRTRHYHVKVGRGDDSLLTTQLYFPGEAKNAGDWLYDPRLELTLNDSRSGRLGRYDFIV